MAHVTSSQTIDAPVETVFAASDDLANLDRFKPAIAMRERLDGTPPVNLGAGRQGTLGDGNNDARERVIEHVPDTLLVVDIFEGTVPIKSAKGTFPSKRRASGSTKVTMHMDVPSMFGVLGKLMIPMMKPNFAKNVRDMPAGNAAYVERGEVVARG